LYAWPLLLRHGMHLVGISAMKLPFGLCCH
jgi:hypothetical protein